MSYFTSAMVAAASGLITAPGAMMIYDYSPMTSLALAGITASSFGSFMTYIVAKNYFLEEGISQ